MSLRDNENLHVEFPSLNLSEIIWSSPDDHRYNCIAWAAGSKRNKWWPGVYGCYWPRDPSAMSDLEEFLEVFRDRGFDECPTGGFEPGFEKLAFYTQVEEGFEEPKHMARQVADGLWWSKMGEDEDIQHTLESLQGPEYGYARRFLRKALVPPAPTP